MPLPPAAIEDPAPPPPALVVLAPAAWKEALAPFVAARSKELAVEFDALEDVLAANEGFDPPERIKRHLHRAWKERRARYALLVGDADTFPVRFMTLDRATSAAFDTAFYPCDLYYADVARDDGAFDDGAFDDWNAAKDGYRARYVGEVRGETHKDGPIDADGISYVPELAVGRFPVSDVASLQALVAKTLAWTPSAPSALLVHADGWVDERARLAAMGTALAGGGFGVEELVYGKRAPTPETLATALRAQPTCVFHLGHGYSEGWAGCVDSTAPFALRGPSSHSRSAATRPSSASSRPITPTSTNRLCGTRARTPARSSPRRRPHPRACNRASSTSPASASASCAAPRAAPSSTSAARRAGSPAR